jgi:DNA-binding beta-propeller fold protein YncE
MNSIPFRIFAGILALALLSGTAVVRNSYSSPSPAANQPWSWPPAPEKPRIQFLKTVITPQDLDIKKGFFAKVWEFIAGKDTADRIVSPHGVVADGGKVYVADWGGSCIHYFDFEKKKYDKFSRTKEGTLVSPIGVALDGDGLLYVTDSEKRKVFVFDGDKNRRIIGNDSLLRPTGIAVNREERILYVVDTAGHRVYLFDLSGREISSFGGRGRADGKFNYPTHIAIGRSGDLFIMDSLNFRVQIFDKTGKFLSKFGGTGTSIHDFVKPKGIAVDSEGHVWVSDSLRSTIQVFDRQGNLLLIFGRIGSGPGEFNIPAGLYIDSKDRLYVADSYNYRLQTYQYLKQ